MFFIFRYYICYFIFIIIFLDFETLYVNYFSYRNVGYYLFLLTSYITVFMFSSIQCGRFPNYFLQYPCPLPHEFQKCPIRNIYAHSLLIYSMGRWGYLSKIIVIHCSYITLDQKQGNKNILYAQHILFLTEMRNTRSM